MPKNTNVGKKRDLIHEKVFATVPNEDNHEKSTQLSIIDLSDAFLGDENCDLLVKALKNAPPYKTSLQLRGNHIKGDGIKILSEMLKNNNSLTSISLEWNSIGVLSYGIDELAKALEINKSILELDLRNNSIRPDGAISLAKALMRNSTLTRLDLRWNEVGSSGGLALVDMLESNKTLVYLNLSGNEISLACIEKIQTLLERNRKLDKLSETNVVSTIRSNHDDTNLLLEYITDKEEMEQNLKILQQKNSEFEEKLETQTYVNKELSFESSRLKDEIAILERRLSESRNINDQMEVEKKQLINRFEQEKAHIINSKESVEKDLVDVKEKKLDLELIHHKELEEKNVDIQKLKDENSVFQEDIKKLRITHRSSIDEIEELRKHLSFERSRWQREIDSIVFMSSEKQHQLEHRCEMRDAEYDSKLRDMIQNLNKAESEKQLIVEEKEMIQAALIREKIESEKKISEICRKNHLDAELRINNFMNGMNEKISQLQRSRDDAQEARSHETQKFISLQDLHSESCKEYEIEINQYKKKLSESEKLSSERENLITCTQNNLNKAESRLEEMTKAVHDTEMQMLEQQKNHMKAQEEIINTNKNKEDQMKRVCEDQNNQLVTLKLEIERRDNEQTNLKKEYHDRISTLSSKLVSFIESSFNEEKDLLS